MPNDKPQPEVDPVVQIANSILNTTEDPTAMQLCPCSLKDLKALAAAFVKTKFLQDNGTIVYRMLLNSNDTVGVWLNRPKLNVPYSHKGILINIEEVK